MPPEHVTVTYKGPEDPRDGTTVFEYGDETFVQDVPRAAPAELAQTLADYKGHEFVIDDAAAPFDGYDAMSADDVVAHLRAHPDEVDAVQAYEAKHKDRKTIRDFEIDAPGGDS